MTTLLVLAGIVAGTGAACGIADANDDPDKYRRAWCTFRRTAATVAALLVHPVHATHEALRWRKAGRWWRPRFTLPPAPPGSEAAEAVEWVRSLRQRQPGEIRARRRRAAA